MNFHAEICFWMAKFTHFENVQRHIFIQTLLYDIMMILKIVMNEWKIVL